MQTQDEELIKFVSKLKSYKRNNDTQIFWLTMDKNTYYYCTCYYFNDELILCAECCEWVDDVETTIEQHLKEFRPLVHAKRWKNNKNNKKQKY